jgi:predicted transcriptional regulator
MDANLDKIAKDLYGKIQTRFRNIKIGDENAEVLSKKEDIPRARFFEFEYEEGGAPLGTIAITLDPQDGVVMQVSGDLTDDDNATHHGAYKFIRGFRQFAKDRLLNFDVQNIGKSNLDKRDYEYQAKRKEMPIMPAIMENKLYGSNRISYQDLGEARLVIKHSQPINLDLPAGRTMHIESIYIENNSGERFKYPYKHLNGARALAEHIKHGGNPYDNIGQHICSLSEELAHLRKFKGYVSRQEQLSEAMANVTGRVMERIETIKETINKLQRTAYYEAFVESFEDQEEQMIPEEVQNDLIDRLTIRTFNEELKSVFPYIYKFIDESEIDVVELGADDLISEKQLSERVTPEWLDIYSKAKELLAKGMSPEQVAKQLGVQGPNNGMAGGMGGNWGAINKAVNELKQSQKPSFESAEDQFENFMNDIVREDKNEVISSNNDAQSAAIEKLNTILAQNMQVGPNGDNAIITLKGLID